MVKSIWFYFLFLFEKYRGTQNLEYYTYQMWISSKWNWQDSSDATMRKFMHFLFHSNVVSNMSSFFTFASMLLKYRRTKIPPRMKKRTMLRAKMDVSSEGNVCCVLHVPISKVSIWQVPQFNIKAFCVAVCSCTCSDAVNQGFLLYHGLLLHWWVCESVILVYYYYWWVCELTDICQRLIYGRRGPLSFAYLTASGGVKKDHPSAGQAFRWTAVWCPLAYACLKDLNN